MTEESETVEYIDLTPTDEGFGNILMFFTRAILHDIPQKRQGAAAKFLDSVLDITRYLALKKPDEVQKVRDYLQRLEALNEQKV